MKIKKNKQHLRLVTGILALALALTMVQCLNEDKSTTNNQTCGETTGTLPSNSGSKDVLVVATGDTSSGAISVIDLSTNTATNNITTVHSDSLLKKINNRPYVLERTPTNTIKLLNPNDNYKVFFEQGLGTDTNPWDIEKINDDCALVANYASNKLSVVSLVNGKTDSAKAIDISAYSSHLGAEANAMIRYNNHIYVTVENLGDSSSNFAAVNTSRLLKINVADINAMSIEKAFDLLIKNPYSDIEYSSIGSKIQQPGWRSNTVRPG